MGDTTAKAAMAIVEAEKLKKQLRTTLEALDRTQHWLDEFQGSLAEKEIEYLRVKNENAKLYALLVELKRNHDQHVCVKGLPILLVGAQECLCGADTHNAKIEAAIRGEL